MSEITVTVGKGDLTFDMGVDDYNAYINETMPTDKVAPAFNLLSRTVVDKSREAFEKAVLIDGKPNGFIVMQIVGVAVSDFGGEVEITLKKPSKSPAA